MKKVTWCTQCCFQVIKEHCTVILLVSLIAICKGVQLKGGIYLRYPMIAVHGRILRFSKWASNSAFYLYNTLCHEIFAGWMKYTVLQRPPGQNYGVLALLLNFFMGHTISWMSQTVFLWEQIIRLEIKEKTNVWQSVLKSNEKVGLET